MTQSKNPNSAQPTGQGELSDDQLDAVSGGQDVVKLGKITVTGKREDATQVASTSGKTKQN